MAAHEIRFCELCPRIYPDNVARAFVVDGMPYDGPVGGADIFGFQWKYIDIAGGSMVEPGRSFLKEVSEWREKVRFPELDRLDWEKSAEENREFLNTDKLVTAWIFNGLFERLISFVDFEAAAVALIDEEQQDDVKALFQELADFYKRLIDKYKRMLVEAYGDQILIGIHCPYNQAVPAPENDEELYRQVEGFLAPYAENIKEKPFFLMDLKPDNRVREAFYKCSMKLLQK